MKKNTKSKNVWEKFNWEESPFKFIADIKDAVRKQYLVSAECKFCGSIKTYQRGHLIRVRSCGCKKGQWTTERLTTHGHAGKKDSSTYCSWANMLDRCRNPKAKAYKHYGGRGIKVCDRWKRFEAFIEDMEECPPKRTLGRIDNNKGYYKANCEWQTRKQQTRNTRRNVLYEVGGIKKIIPDWCEIYGISITVVRHRIKSGMPIEKALTQPVKRKRNDQTETQRTIDP